MTSISYGDDVVGRLSLGSVRNIGHAMRALLAMRPPPPPSPPTSPPSSPHLSSTPTTTTEIDLIHDSSESLEDLLEQEGEGLNFDAELRAESAAEAASAERHKQQNKKPALPSIGLEIVQKVIRWRLTGEEELLEEFMDIRRAMHREMERHQDFECHINGDLYPPESAEFSTTTGDDEHQRAYHHGERTLDLNKISPVLVPAGKVLWIRPTTLEKELENEETKQHPLESVLHQFEWDHPMDHRDAASMLIPAPISRGLQQSLEDDHGDSTSIRSFKSTVRSSLYSAQSSPNLSFQHTAQLSSSPPTPSAAQTQTHTLSPVLGITTSHLTPPSSQQTAPAPRLTRQGSADSVGTFLTTASAATTTSPVSLHPTNQNTDKLLYRMYAVPEPENVFDEMLFSRRMWSDHLPLTYEFILAGKHAIPVTSPHGDSSA